MSVFKRLALRLAQKAGSYAGVTFNIGDPQLNQKLSDVGWGWGSSSASGKSINDTTAMNVTAFFAGVRLLAETMGSLPRGVFARDGDNSVPAFDHRLHEVLVHQPNQFMNGIEYTEASTANLAARGNAYSLIERGGDGNVSSLWNFEASRVTMRRNETTDWEPRYFYNDRGKEEAYPPEKIWHRRLFSFGGLRGLSPIECAKEALGLAMAGEEFNARLFAQGLMPSARVSIPEWLTKEQRILANQRLMEMHAGLTNMGKPMLLEGGMKVESGLITPEEAQFLSLRQMTVVEICRILGIKPHMVAALERATDNNIEKLSLEFVTYTMLPYIRRDEAAARQLFKPGDRAKYFFRYNFEGLLRADSAARASLYSILLQNGVFSRNEVRALENRNKSSDKGMDDFTVQTNMAMIDQLAKLVAAQAIASNAPKGNGEEPTKANEQLAMWLKALSAERSPTVSIHEGAIKVETTVEPARVDIHKGAIKTDTRIMPSEAQAEREQEALEVVRGAEALLEQAKAEAEQVRRERKALEEERAAPRVVIKEVVERDSEGRILRTRERQEAA